MKTTHLNDRRTAPAWVVVGAPLVGVPLLVALLSLTAPGRPADESAGADAVETEILAVEAVLWTEPFEEPEAVSGEGGHAHEDVPCDGEGTTASSREG